MEEVKLLITQNGIALKEKSIRGNTGHNIIKIAHGKDNFYRIVIVSCGRNSQIIRCYLEVC